MTLKLRDVMVTRHSNFHDCSEAQQNKRCRGPSSNRNANVYCSGPDKKRISNSGRLPGSSREPSPEALELSPPGAQGPQGQAPGVMGATRDSSRASGEGSREDPGSRPELEIRFLSGPEQYGTGRGNLPAQSARPSRYGSPRQFQSSPCETPDGREIHVWG